MNRKHLIIFAAAVVAHLVLPGQVYAQGNNRTTVTTFQEVVDGVVIDIPEEEREERGHARLWRERRGITIEVKTTQRTAITGHFPLALDYMNFHARLIVRSGGEHLAVLRGNPAVSMNQPAFF